MDPKAYQSQDAGKAILTPMGLWAFLPNPLPPTILWSSSLMSALSAADRDLSRLCSLIGAFPFLAIVDPAFHAQ